MPGVDAIVDRVVRGLEVKLGNTDNNHVPFNDGFVECRPWSLNTPEYVSIGHHHWGTSQLLQRDSDKVFALHQLLSLRAERARCTTTESLELLAGEVKRLLVEMNYCGFNRNYEPEQAALVEMMLLDGCYLLSAFFGKVPDAPWANLVRDTWYKLENQMPFQVVEKIYGVIPTVHGNTDALKLFKGYARTLLQSMFYICNDPREHSIAMDRQDPPLEQPDALKLFKGFARTLLQIMSYISSDPRQHSIAMARQHPPLEQPRVGGSHERPCHLLDLLHILLKPTKKSEPTDGGCHDRNDSNCCTWHRATEYVKNSNVQFVKRHLDGSKARSVLDVNMEGDEVQIPQLFINGNTWTILRNLMALEEQQSRGAYVTDYCLFMSQLVCTPDDVELLLRADIINHTLGDPLTVAEGFCQLSNGVNYNSNRNSLKLIWQKLDRRYRSPWHEVLSWFRLKYWGCKNLPVVIALLVTILVLASEVVSAVFQVLPYYHH